MFSVFPPTLELVFVLVLFLGFLIVSLRCLNLSKLFYQIVSDWENGILKFAQPDQRALLFNRLSSVVLAADVKRNLLVKV